MKINEKRGISLIVLVITIIVIIVLAGAVILSLANNNPISQATKATFLSDVSNFKSELTLYEVNQFSDKKGIYDVTLLQADETSVTYNGVVDNNKTMNDLIPTLGKTIKYSGQFVVIDGELVYQGSDTNIQNWSIESGLKVEVLGEPKVTIVPPLETVVVQGTDIIYILKFTSNAALTKIDLTDKVEVTDNLGVSLVVQPTIILGTISGTNMDSTRQVTVTIKTNSLVNGAYKLKIKAGSATNINDISNLQDTISSIGFDLDNIAPTNPTISVNPTSWTKDDVIAMITYSEDSATKEYSLNGTTWYAYTVPVVVTTNNTTVYARGKDLAGNQSSQSTITITNIDKTAPTMNAVVNTSITTFNYTGAVQTFVAPASGTYKLDVWGAQGGTGTFYGNLVGGEGGYAYGNLFINEGQTLNIYVGGQGSSADNSLGGFNGGGNGYSSGGGATDIRLGGINLTNRIIVAGGGGGSLGQNNQSSGYPLKGGVGGGLTGGNPTGSTSFYTGQFGTGGTQTSGGTMPTQTYYSTGVSEATLGNGGSKTRTNADHLAGGGGGYYGGAAGTAGAGGSSYIGSLTNSGTSAGVQSGNGKATITKQGGDQTITVNALDGLSGILSKKWSQGIHDTTYFENNGTNITNDSFAVNETGDYTIYLKDQAGNEIINTINVTVN